MFINLCNTS